jgi:hypothetical protein
MASAFSPVKTGAGDESRTRDLNLGKVALYQLSYSRKQDRHFIVMKTQRQMRASGIWRIQTAPAFTAMRM